MSSEAEEVARGVPRDRDRRRMPGREGLLRPDPRRARRQTSRFSAIDLEAQREASARTVRPRREARSSAGAAVRLSQRNSPEPFAVDCRTRTGMTRRRCLHAASASHAVAIGRAAQRVGADGPTSRRAARGNDRDRRAASVGRQSAPASPAMRWSQARWRSAPRLLLARCRSPQTRVHSVDSR